MKNKNSKDTMLFVTSDRGLSKRLIENGVLNIIKSSNFMNNIKK